MKKFLSLVLALVMTMSLVTIGAGATEYKDLTDKSEIQYEEAVAVLNKIGIITGYEDGSFKPTGALTRGAAAKIIVSLMIGSDAASSLTVAAAPYKDVPVTNTFAAVISYCKTAGYINGYSDGTFRPTAALTGYAFAKMLLGALGYDGKVEGFSGSGWTMKVASVGNVAGLYNDFKTPFQGNAGVTREQACQLALNTLKATKVEYKGDNINVTTGDANVSITNQNHTDVVNKSNTDGNIYKDPTGNYTNGKDGLMQFAEQHFTDLKQVNSTSTDKYGHPANVWSYKNVTIGKYSVGADYTFTAGPSGDTKLDQIKDMGLDGYKITSSTTVYVNGENKASDVFKTPAASSTPKDLKSENTWMTNLLNYVKNGSKVEVFIADNAADQIKAIVVTESLLVQVNTVSSKNVTLKQADNVETYIPFKTVKDGDDGFAELKGLKADDYVLVTWTVDNGNVVDTVKIPQTATGALTGVSKNKSNKVNGVTVGGTAYKLSKNHDTDIDNLSINSITSAKKDVTLYLDAYGYVAGQKDITSSSNFMIVGDKSQTLVNGKLVTTLEGYDMDGKAVSANVSSTDANMALATPGSVIKYVASNSSNYDYSIASESRIENGNTVSDTDPVYVSGGTANRSGYVAVDMNHYTASPVVNLESKDITLYGTKVVGGAVTPIIASGVKTIFMDFDTDGSIQSIYVKNGVANVQCGDLVNAELYINDKGAVETIIVKTTSTDAISANVAYVQSVKNSVVVDGTRTYTYHVWVNGGEEDFTSTNNLTVPCYATYSEGSNGNYQMSAVTRYDSATSAFVLTINKNAINDSNKNLVYGVNKTSGTFTNGDSYPIFAVATSNGKIVAGTPIAAGTTAGLIESDSTLNFDGATWNDLTYNGISSLKSLHDSDQITDTAASANITLLIVMNNKVSADNRYKVTNVTLLGA